MQEAELKRDFGRRIKAIRELSGMSIRDFAAYIDANPCTIVDWGEGRALPNFSSIKAICEKFGISADWLLDIRWDQAEVPIDESEAQALIRSQGHHDQ